MSSGESVIRLRGELDLQSARPTRDEVVALLEPDRRVVVDLSDVSFMDSSGLGSLVYALREAKAVGATLVVANPQPWVRKLFEAAGVAELFGLASTAAAVPASPAPDRAVDPIAEACTLLHGYENLLRWGDLTPEQVTIALSGTSLANASDDLALAERVRAALEALGEAPTESSDD